MDCSWLIEYEITATSADSQTTTNADNALRLLACQGIAIRGHGNSLYHFGRKFLFFEASPDTTAALSVGWKTSL